MDRPLRIAVLASGRGSNLAALLRACVADELHARVIGVWSDRPSAPALDLARVQNIPAQSLRPRDFIDREAFDRALFADIDAALPDLIVCAGFMRILSAAVVAAHSQQMINIHPSLLPRHPGLDTHSRAIAAGDSDHGASVHFMIPALDAGPVIAQTPIAIRADDNPQSLAERLLPAEHELLVATVALFTRHRLGHTDGRVLIDGQPLAAPLQMIDDQLQPASPILASSDDR